MKIKDIKIKPDRIANEEAIKFLYFLMDWNGSYFDFIKVRYNRYRDEIKEAYFDSVEEARAFIDNLELEEIDKITCDFRTGAITRFEFCFQYGFGDPRYGIINVTSREK